MALICGVLERALWVAVMGIVTVVLRVVTAVSLGLMPRFGGGRKFRSGGYGCLLVCVVLSPFGFCSCFCFFFAFYVLLPFSGWSGSFFCCRLFSWAGLMLVTTGEGAHEPDFWSATWVLVGGSA